jgi:hypothetical protein
MGRPLTTKCIGKPAPEHRVLWPLIRMNGKISRGYILRQLGADKFLVECCDTGTIGACRLCNTIDMAIDGLMCLRFSGAVSGFVSRISNTRLKDFHGNQFDWSMHLDNTTKVSIVDITA